MTSARDGMLAAVRGALGRDALPEDTRAALDRRLDNPTANVVPRRGRLDREGRIALFRAEAERVNATTARVATMADVAGEVASLLRGRNLPMVVKCAPDPALDAVGWDREPALTVTAGPADEQDKVTVTLASAGIAETGTAVMVSSTTSPVLLSFLPTQHVVVLREDDVVGSYEELWARLRAEEEPGTLPRCVNWITGPSRTADIEQTLLLGAHGPRSLHIILVGK